MIAFEKKKKKKRGSFSSSRSRMTIEEQRTPSFIFITLSMNELI